MGFGGAGVNRLARGTPVQPVRNFDAAGDEIIPTPKTPEQALMDAKWGSQPMRERLAMPGMLQRAAAASVDRKAADLAAAIPTDANSVLDGKTSLLDGKTSLLDADAAPIERIVHTGSLYKAAIEHIAVGGEVSIPEIVRITGTSSENAAEVMLALRERGELPEPKPLVRMPPPFRVAATIQDQGLAAVDVTGQSKQRALVDTSLDEPSEAIRVDAAGIARPETKRQAGDTERARNVNLAAQAREVNLGNTPDVQKAQADRLLSNDGALPTIEAKAAEPLLSIDRESNVAPQNAAEQKPSIPEYGKATPGAISLTGVHYSTASRTTLSGSSYGTGHKGGERSRLMDARDRRLRSRVYFYVDEGNGVRPESGVGGIAHQVQLHNIYDPATKTVLSGRDSNEFESNVLDAGFDGYYAKGAYVGQGGVVVLNPKDSIPVAPANPPRKQEEPKAAPTTVKVGLLSNEISAVEANLEELKKQFPDLQIRAGNATIAAEKKAEFVKAVAAATKVVRPLDGAPGQVKVDGKEVAFGPHIPARKAAVAYAKSAGIDYRPTGTYTKIDAAFSKRLADAYEAMKSNPSGPEVKAAYDAMIAETLAQWQEIKKTGLKVEFIAGADPYGNPRNAILDVVNNNHLWVYPTESGFGTEGDATDRANPLLAPTGETISGRPALANDIFRIVHDYFGHIKDGNGFRAEGEENAWQSHAAMYTPLARRAMTSETRGQNSFVNYGPNAEKNRTANGADTVYAPQKVGLMPEWASEERRAEPMLSIDREIAKTKTKLPDIGGSKSRALAKIAKNLTAPEREKLNRGTAERLVDEVRKLPSVDEMAAVAFAGRAKRGWYKGSARAIATVFGPDAPRFAALLAAMSPQTSVEINLRNALATWKNWVLADRPQSKAEILQIMGRSVEGSRGVDSVLAAWVPNTVRALTDPNPMADVLLSGPKVNSFMRNLVGDVNEVTNDAWMANFALVNQTMFAGGLNKTDSGKGPGYLAMSSQVRGAAARLTELTGEKWTPAEVQETIWSWSKTLYELQKDGLTAGDILYNEELTDDLIASTPDFRSLFHDEQNAAVIRAAGFGGGLSDLADERASEQEPAARSEASPFDRATQSQHEARAARRLEQLKAQGDGARLSIEGGVDGTGSRSEDVAKGAAPSQPVSPEGAAAVAALQDAIARQIPGFVLNAVPAPTERARGVSEFAQQVFGKQVAWVHQDDRLFNGAVAPGHSGVVIIDDHSGKPEMAVLGHEMLHNLRVERPDLYAALRTALHGNIRNVAGYADSINQAREAAGMEKLDEDVMLEELIADIVGDRFTEAEFWDSLNMGGASMTRRVLKAVANFLDHVLAQIKALRPFGTERYLNDIKAARRAVAKALGDYAEGEQQAGAGDAALSVYTPPILAPNGRPTNLTQRQHAQVRTPEFKKWFGDWEAAIGNGGVWSNDVSKVVDDNGEPLVVYHGTDKAGFAAFNEPGGTKRGDLGIFFTDSKPMARTYVRKGRARDVEADDLEEGASKFGGLYGAFLNLREPNEEDFNGANWDGEHARGFEPWRVIDANGDPAYAEDGRDTLSLTAAQELLVKTPGSRLEPVRLTGFSTDSVARDGRNGHDGSIMRNVQDDGGGASSYAGEPSTIFVAHKPNQVKSADFNTGSFDDNEDDIRLSIQRDQLGRRARLIKRLDAIVDPTMNLPDREAYMKDRYETMGRMGRADKIANTVRKALRAGTQEDNAQAYAFLTDAGARPNSIDNLDVRAAAVQTKALLGSIADQLVDRGLLNPEVREEYRDRYLPRLYLKHMLGDSGGGMSGGKKVSDQGYLKKRKDIPEDVRRVLLGEITDAPFLASVGVSKPMRDMAILDFLERVSGNDAWILPNALATWNDQRVTPQWLQAEAAWLRKRADYPTSADATAAKEMAVRMEEAAATALREANASETDTSKYRRIPDSARYGRLRGLWVRKEIHDDLVGVYSMRPEDMTTAESVLGFGGIGTKIQQIFKLTKVVLNPPSQVRNIVGNMVAIQLSGVPLRKLAYRYAQAINDMRQDGRFTQMARQYGLLEATFSGVELPEAKTEMLRVLLEHGDGTMHPLMKMGLMARWLGSSVVQKAGDAYQYFETMGKVAKLIDGVESGMRPYEAALEAHKWLFDYTLVNNNIRYLRNVPIGAPFASWMAKNAPRMLEVALMHPQRFLPYIGLHYSLPYFWALLGLGEEPDDIEKAKKLLPEWMMKKSSIAALPIRDSEGRMQVMDVGPYLPWSMYGDMLQGARNGSIADAVKPLAGAFFGGPIADGISMLNTGVDPFTQKPVADRGDTPERQFYAWANYAYNMAMPPVLTSMGVVSPMGLADPAYGGKLWQAASGSTDKFGNERATYGQALSRLVGANVYSVDPDLSRAANIQRMMLDVNATQQQLIRKMQDRSTTEEQRQSTVKEYAAEMKRRADKVTEYTKNEVPPATRPKK
jgi:ADP-Ribosyltransferase in polyvalent proteins